MLDHGIRAMFVSTHSLATAAHCPSGDRAISRMGRVHRVSIFSYVYESSEYMQTVPSSDPVRKKSFYTSHQQEACRDRLVQPTEAAIAVLFS